MYAWRLLKIDHGKAGGFVADSVPVVQNSGCISTSTLRLETLDLGQLDFIRTKRSSTRNACFWNNTLGILISRAIADYWCLIYRDPLGHLTWPLNTKQYVFMVSYTSTGLWNTYPKGHSRCYAFSTMSPSQPASNLDILSLIWIDGEGALKVGDNVVKGIRKIEPHLIINTRKCRERTSFWTSYTRTKAI